MNRAAPTTRTARRIAVFGALWFAALCLGAASPAAAQSYWELSPYRIQVMVAVEKAPELGGRWESELLVALAQRADSTMGAVWEANIEVAPSPLRSQMLHALDSISADAFADQLAHCDKIVLLTVAKDATGFQVAARELDCATRRWSLTQRRDVRQPALLVGAVFDAWLAAFAPLGRVSRTEGDVATLQLKAAALAASSPQGAFFELGDVFQPIARRNQRDGTPAPDGIQSVPWAFLKAAEVDGAQLRCKIHSGMRNALAIGRRGRVELYALRVTRGETPTELRLRSRTDAERPLAGYEVLTQSPRGGEIVRLGLSNRQGEIQIPPGDEPLRILYVKHGSRVLGRVPLVPGLTPVETVTLIDDDLRLRIEGQLVGLEETLIDLVAQREMLMARIRNKLDEGDAAAAAKFLERLRRLPSREEFALRISQLEKSAATRDPVAEAEIKRLFERTKGLLGKYLDLKPISEIQTLVDKSKAG